EVALRAGMVVAGPGIHAGIAGRRPAARRRDDTALALPVVERTQDDRPVDVAFQEPHQDLLPEPRPELAAHAGAGIALRDPEPAAVAIVRPPALLEVELHPHAAEPVAMQFLAALGAGAAFRPHHDRGLVTGGGGARVRARARAVGQHGPPRARAVDG